MYQRDRVVHATRPVARLPRAAPTQRFEDRGYVARARTPFVPRRSAPFYGISRSGAGATQSAHTDATAAPGAWLRHAGPEWALVSAGRKGDR